MERRSHAGRSRAARGRSALRIPLGLALLAVAAAWLVVELRGGAGASARATAAPADEGGRPPVVHALDTPLDGPGAETRESVETSAPAASAADWKPADGTSVRGRCVDWNGHALADVELRIGTAVVAHSQADGTFSMPVPMEGQVSRILRLDARKEGYGSKTLTFTARARAEHDLGDVLLGGTGSVRGRVVDEQASPVPGAQVVLAQVGPGNPDAAVDGPALVLRKSSSDAAGSFLLEGAPAGDLQVWARTPETAWTWSEVLHLDPGEAVTGVELPLHAWVPDDSIRLRVLRPDGEPIPGAVVRYCTAPGPIRRASQLSTDAEGRGRLAMQPRTSYGFLADDPAWHWGPAVALDVPPGTQDLVLQTTPRATFEVRVTDPEGRPVEAFGISVEDAGDRFGTIGPAREVAPHPGGVAELLNPNIPFRLRLEADGWALSTFGPYDPAHVPSPLVLALAEGAFCRGRVTQGGQGVAGARVSLHRAAPDDEPLCIDGFPARSEKEPATRTTTDASGAYALRVPEAGSWYVRAEARELAPADAGPLDLGPDAGASGVDLELSAGGSLLVQVQVLSPEDPSDHVVGISRADGRALSRRTDANGEVRFDGLTPGPWLVRPLEGDLGSMTFSTRFPAQGGADLPWSTSVADGEVTRFVLDLRDRIEVAGRFSLSGASTTGWQARLQSQDPGQMELHRAPLGPDGRFVLRADAPGRFRLWVSGTIDGRTAFVQDDLDLDRGPTPWDCVLPSGRVEGTVQTAEMEQGALVSYVWHEGSRLLLIQTAPDASGRFTLPFVPAGEGGLSCKKADGSSASASIEVAAGETTSGVELR